MKIGLCGSLILCGLLGGCEGANHPDLEAGAGSHAAPGSEADLVGNVGDRVYFSIAAHSLSPDAEATLDRQAGWLLRNGTVRVQIAGNSDDRGTEEYNIALAARRADIVRGYLTTKGVESTRISTISYGKDRPTILGDDNQSWQQNRNAITIVQ